MANGRKKDAYGMGVHGEIKKFVVTLGVMRHFFIVRGAPRACVDFGDPTAIARFNSEKPNLISRTVCDSLTINGKPEGSACLSGSLFPSCRHSSKVLSLPL